MKNTLIRMGILLITFLDVFPTNYVGLDETGQVHEGLLLPKVIALVLIALFGSLILGFFQKRFRISNKRMNVLTIVFSLIVLSSMYVYSFLLALYYMP